MKGLVIKDNGTAGQPGKAEVVDNLKEPSMRPGHIKVKTVAVALNPLDFKNVDFMGQPGCLLGAEYAGIVEEVGSDCTSTVKKGDAVFGLCHGANSSQKEDGAFAEIAMNRDGILGKKPEGLSWEEAAMFPTAILTCGMGMYQLLGLPLPDSVAAPTEDSPSILIYGGSTAMGMMAIQYAKLSGYKIYTTASPRNHELVKSYGAFACFDYNDPECGAKIRAATGNKLYKAFDCVASADTAKICADALSTNLPSTPTNADGSPKSYDYIPLLPVKFPRSDAAARPMMSWNALGESFAAMGREFPAVMEDYEHAKRFWVLSTKLIAEGKLRPLPVEVRGGGLAGVIDGMDDYRQGKVSGTKLVYHTADTPEL